MGLFSSIRSAIGSAVNAITGKSNYVKDITPSSSTPSTPAQTSYSFVPQSTIDLAKAIEARGGTVPSQTLVTSSGKSYTTGSGGSSGGGTTTPITNNGAQNSTIQNIQPKNIPMNSGVKTLSPTLNQNIKDYGLFSGTLRSAGEASKSLVPAQKLSILSDYYGYESKGTGSYNPQTKQFEPIISSQEKLRREQIKTQNTQEALSGTVQIAPYLIPPLAIPLSIVTGGEQLIYPKAREGLYQTAENFGLPKQVGLILPIAQIGLGAYGAYKGISTLTSSSPSTKVLGVAQNIEENQIVTNLYSKTQIKNIFGTKELNGLSASKIDIAGTSEGITVGKTTTSGFYSSSPFTFDVKTLGNREITATNVKNPQFFGAGSYSLSTPSEVVFQDVNKIPYTKEGIQGFTQVNIGGIATKKGANYFAGIGGGIQEGQGTAVFGTSGLVNKGKISNVGNYNGLIIQKIQEPSSEFFSMQGGGAKSSPEYFKQLYGNAVQSSQSFIVSKATSMPKITKGMLPIVSAQQISQPIEKNYPTYVGGIQVQSYKQLQLSKVSLSPIADLTQRSKERQGATFSQFSGQIPNEAQRFSQVQIPMQIQVPGQAQIFKQEQRQSQAQKVGTAVPINPILDIPNPRISLPNFNFGFSDTQMGKRKIGVRKIVKYVPSFSALVFDIHGRAPKGTETGLRLRPITQGFSFANLFSKRVIKVRRRRK